MEDSKTTIEELKKLMIQMAQEREWDQFHSPKNLAMDIAIEAGELMELFVWCTTQESDAEAEKQKTEIEHELADILIVAFLFANRTGIDITQAVKNKLKIICERYPVHLGNAN